MVLRPCFTVILALLMFSKAAAQDIRFVEESDWPPFTPDYIGFANEGLSFDLMTEILGRIDQTFTLELLPQKRVLSRLRTGTADAVTVVSKNKERERYINFSVPIFQKLGLVWFNHSRTPNFEWQSYEDLKGLKIGIVLGHNYGDDFIAAVKKYDLTLEPVTREEQNFAKLKAGRVDVVLSVEMVARQIFRNYKYMGVFSAAEKPYYSKDYHVGFSKASPSKSLLPKVNQAIRGAKSEGVLQKIVARHVEGEI